MDCAFGKETGRRIDDMAGKVTFEVTKGALSGRKFEYEGKQRIFIGRQEDCGIVVPENTVSRYHCVLEMTPPEVKLQDFGSLNGTFLNGEKIGQRDREISYEQARDEYHQEFILRDGDVLGLGKNCELKLAIEAAEEPQVPVGKKLPREYKSNGTGTEIERLAGELAEQFASALAEQQCAGCGKTFIPTAPDNNLCPDCLADRDKVLDALLVAMLYGAGIGEKGEEKAIGDSPVKGYEKIKLLGKGGMGEVWKVRETSTGKCFALKTMLPEVASDEKAKKIFLREAEIGKIIEHKNVVRSYKTGCINGEFYILMDLCEGGSADGLMARKGGRLTLETATWITLQVLSGLDYVHNKDLSVPIQKGIFKGTRDAHGIVHRDFKPGNIFLSDTSDHPVAMVADFGMAKAFDTAGLSRITKSGTLMGTPVFMPRQQAINFKYSKPEVDVWAAAAAYYNMLTGEFPKNFRPGKNVWHIIISESAVPIRQRDANIPEKLAAVIDKALIEQPSIGYATAASLSRDIISALPEATRQAVRGVL